MIASIFVYTCFARGRERHGTQIFDDVIARISGFRERRVGFAVSLNCKKML